MKTMIYIHFVYLYKENSRLSNTNPRLRNHKQNRKQTLNTK